MAKQASVNNTPANGAFAMVDLFDLLIAAGWVVQSESDGTTYEADVPLNGRQITGGGVGANGWDNVNAWSRIQDPGGERELTFQRTTSATTWRSEYSALDGFIGGTPSATQTPSATDGQIIQGSGTNAAPVGAVLFVVAMVRFHIVAFDTANSRGVYPFWAFGMTAANIASTAIMMEPIDPASIPPLVGTRAAPTTGDPDPVIVLASNAAANQYRQNTWAAAFSPTESWYQMNNTNGGAEAWLSHRATAHTSFTPASSASVGLGLSPYDTTEEGIPFFWGRPLADAPTAGFKGYSEYLRIKGVDKEYPSTINLATDAYVYVEDYLVPWPNGVTPL